MATSPFSLPTSFNSSPLVRLLASLGIAPAMESTPTVAEPISQWIAWTDAIALSQVLADAPVAGATAAVTGVVDQVARVRNDLVDAISHDALLTDPAPPVVHSGAASVGKVDYSAYRRQYRAHQHTMEDRIGELRARVRTAIAGASPALRHLAALDAVLDRALAVHQRRLLEKVPLMLEQRFRALYAAQPVSPGDAPARAAGPTVQRVLLAELETRMQPVQGLIDALGHGAATPA